MKIFMCFGRAGSRSPDKNEIIEALLYINSDNRAEAQPSSFPALQITRS